MTKRMKSLMLGATLIVALPILGGCGSNNIGYVDSIKVANNTEKGIAITKEINAKDKELQAKVAAADEATRPQVIQEARQEFAAFSNAKASEYRQYQEQQINELVKDKKLDVVIEKGAVIGGGTDVTEDLINKMGKASEADIKAMEQEAQAEASQEAQAGAQ
ncbi:hypothetical protein [Veillonella agrestimuris]|uniref:hypothetical protein n=1 Tax=Veillonella agrestimuris TaxID=2941340 RepID=UPI00203E5014|nr:hypothetical protein [Veillonella agrestimuris]